MILEILKFVHVVSGVIGICAGTWVVFGIVAGRMFQRWTVVFLKCGLVASATGLFFPFHHFLPTHWAAMSVVYVSGIAVLAWRRYHFVGIWAHLFTLSIMLVFCLSVLVVIAHVFKMLFPTQPNLLFLITESMVMLFFVGLGILTVKRYRN
jgi:hypothetical protein